MEKTDTILAHCIARAVMADTGGEEAARARYGDNAEGLQGSKWRRLQAQAPSTPRAASNDATG